MADDEQFSLCWNNFNTNLSAGFHESLIQGDLVDVTLAAEGQLVKAHRLILSVCSPYFRKMFTQMPANQHAFIFLKDVSHSALKDLIQFMYCGEVNVKQDALPAFISTAEALQIKGLTETGESAPAQQSPAKDTSHHLPSSGVTTIPSSASSPRAKPLQRSRIQSYKIDSDNESEHEKVVQIQATSTPATASSSSSGPSATIVTSQISTAPQQVQIIQQQQQAQKRSLQQRASITPQTTQVLKRAKLSDPLEASEPAQIQTVQIVKQITQTPQQTISSEAEYVEMPIETINPKAEPDYADDPSEVEAIETEHEHEHEHEQALTEHEAAEHDQDADDNYVEDETYGDMAKYDESYFTEGEEVKAGASGFGSESYTESGTAADQAAQEIRDTMAAQSTACLPSPKRAAISGSSSGVAPVKGPDAIKFIRSQKKKPQLVYRGFLYNRKLTQQNGNTTWRCIDVSKLRCKAICVTKFNRLIRAKRAHIHENHENRIVNKPLYDYPEDLEEYLEIYSRDPISSSQKIDVIDDGTDYKVVVRDTNEEEAHDHMEEIVTKTPPGGQYSYYDAPK